MQNAFKNSIEQDRLDTNDMRKLMKKVNSPVFRVLTRLIGMRMEFHVAAVHDIIASGIQLIIQKDDVYVGNLMTHPEHRCRGLARDCYTYPMREPMPQERRRYVLMPWPTMRTLLVSTKMKDSKQCITMHVSSFDSDSVFQNLPASGSGLIVRSVNKIDNRIMEPLLDHCFPPLYLATKGCDKFIKDYIPSRIVRYLIRRFGNQSINTYAFYRSEADHPFGYVQVSQSGVEDRIDISSPILAPEENDLFLKHCLQS